MCPHGSASIRRNTIFVEYPRRCVSDEDWRALQAIRATLPPEHDEARSKLVLEPAFVLEGAEFGEDLVELGTPLSYL